MVQARRKTEGESAPKWVLTRDNLLTMAGLIMLGFELVNAEALGRTFHPEFLVAGLALCGIGIFQKLDRGTKD